MVETENDDLFHKLWLGFSSLRGSPSELWKAYVLKFLDSFSYFSFSMTLTMFLSADFHFTDVQAGMIYGTWGALITVYGVVAGYLMDNFGVAMCLRLGVIIALIAKIMIFFTTERWVMLLNVLLIMPLGNCLGIPVLAVGIRRYTNDCNRGFAFGLFYVTMNIAALLAGIIVDFCARSFPEDNPPDDDIDDDEIFSSMERHLSSSSSHAVHTEHAPAHGNNTGSEGSDGSDDDRPMVWEFTVYRAVILCCIFANMLACLISLTVREIKVSNSPKQPATASSVQGGGETSSSPEATEKKDQSVSSFTPRKANPLQIAREIVRSRNFWRFFLVCLLTLNVRMIFRHLDATWPKYMVREFGPHVPKGTIYSLNPALNIIAVPVISAATADVDPLVMIHIGCYVSALSVFWLAASTSLWASVMFVLTLSMGEASWSPRLYEYTMSVVVEGREGAYMALSSAPLFLAKLPVGILSGFLLQKYCPKEGVRDSEMMWFVIGAISMVSPIMITLCWKIISNRTEGECELCRCCGGAEDHDDEEDVPTLEHERVKTLQSTVNMLELETDGQLELETDLEPCPSSESKSPPLREIT